LQGKLQPGLDMMAGFLADAWIVDAIVALVGVEAVVLVLWRARTGGGIAVAETLANLSSGAALLLALRVAITGPLSTSVLCLLSVALIAHVADLVSRWEAGSGRRPNEGSPVASPKIGSEVLRIGSKP
jgi:hypothetical protein